VISKDKIFDLFENKEANLVDIHEDFMDNSFVKIGMFNKIIQNNEVFFQKLKYYYQKNNITYNLDDVSSYSKFVTYNRAFFYLNQIDINKTTHIDALACYDFDLLIKNLNQSILFFEEREEYEKCAHLFSIKQAVEKLSKVA
jgi:hypothetical protein